MKELNVKKLKKLLTYYFAVKCHGACFVRIGALLQLFKIYKLNGLKTNFSSTRIFKIQSKPKE